MGAVEDVLVAAAARHCGDLAAVEAHAHVAHQLGLRRRGGFSYCAAEVKPCRGREKILQTYNQRVRYEAIPASVWSVLASNIHSFSSILGPYQLLRGISVSLAAECCTMFTTVAVSESLRNPAARWF